MHAFRRLRQALQQQHSSDRARANRAGRPSSAWSEAVPEAGAARAAAARRGHDFSAVPALCKAPVGLQAKLALHAPGDAYEREADSVSERVMGMPQPQSREQTRLEAVGVGGSSAAPHAARGVLASPGRPLDAQTRAFMEPRFGHDLGTVRIHTGEQGAAAAQRVGARAFTVGRDIVFGAGEYRAGTTASRSLLAHELAHVVQQTSAGPSIQRQKKPELTILDASSKKKETSTERRAAVSCPITCGSDVVGTLHAMPLFDHVWNKDPEKSTILTKPGSGEATGVGIALHFVKSAPKDAKNKKDACTCSDFKIIQVVQTTHAGSKDNKPLPQSFVDINPDVVAESKDKHPTPYYADWARNSRDRPANEIPKGYPDAGSTVKADHSIYDRPSRDPQRDLADHADLSWEAEARVVCVGNPNKILGGIIYGFSREFDAGYKPLQHEPPRCVEQPTPHFIHTLSTDENVKGYDFEGKEPAPKGH
jgi:hypothetical protein